jgi:hypothetical protein
MIIGICGEKRHGKDSCANVLIEKFGFRRYSFAEPIRESIKNIFLWDDDWIDNHKEEIDPYWGISYRQAAQDLGTEWGRVHLGEMFPQFKSITQDALWICRAEKYINSFSEEQRWVIPDVRFPNEELFIKGKGGKLLRVVRPSMINQGDTHPSEKWVSSFNVDYEIINDNSLKELENKIATIFSNISLT